jgi:hypothetical protein
VTEDPRITEIRAALGIYFDVDLDDPNCQANDHGDAIQALEAIRSIVDSAPKADSRRPDRCPARVPEGNVITEGRQCQQYAGHPHDHTWYGDNGSAYSAWTQKSAEVPRG